MKINWAEARATVLVCALTVGMLAWAFALLPT